MSAEQKTGETAESSSKRECKPLTSPQSTSALRRKNLRERKVSNDSVKKIPEPTDVSTKPMLPKSPVAIPTRRRSTRHEKQTSPSSASPLNRKKIQSSSKLCVDFSAVKKEKSLAIDDENAINSDNSDSNYLYHDVDWEETLENDAQMDDFGPRRRTDKVEAEVEKCEDSEEILDPPTANFSLFKPGDRVKVHNYTTSTWDEGVIEDVDDLEQEALVVVNNTKEWLSIDSQRISKIGDADGEDTADTPSLASIIGGPAPPISLESIIQQVRLEETIQEEPKKTIESSRIRKSITVKKTTKDDASLDTRPIDKLRRRSDIVKRKDFISGSSVPYSKFKENEKVLAKWSNYRMGRFPAVIKAAMPNKEYEVLFYDGFVKTIPEENICKATEEELVKYEGADPSKADTFVELEEDSKEARRQRKKKIFDDYFSAKDLERPRRKFPPVSEVMRLMQQKRSTRIKRLQTKIGQSKKRVKPKRQMEGAKQSAQPEDGLSSDETTDDDSVDDLKEESKSEPDAKVLETSLPSTGSVQDLSALVPDTPSSVPCAPSSVPGTPSSVPVTPSPAPVTPPSDPVASPSVLATSLPVSDVPSSLPGVPSSVAEEFQASGSDVQTSSTGAPAPISDMAASILDGAVSTCGDAALPDPVPAGSEVKHQEDSTSSPQTALETSSVKDSQSKTPVPDEKVASELESQSTSSSSPAHQILQSSAATPLHPQNPGSESPASVPVAPVQLAHSSKPLPDYGDRFKCKAPEGAAPILIKTKDGRAHKSIIVGDRNLLPNWFKHAVNIRGKIQIFLISPEGYKLNSRLDLQDFYLRTSHSHPPPVLDFAIDTTVIPGLVESQAKLDVAPVRYPTWKINKGRKRLPGPKKSRFTPFKGKSPGPGRPKLSSSTPRPSTRVRTILPRYRYEPIPLEPEPEKEWICPKDGCDKKFRKESLLQMHIKHYHVEFKALVGAAPNVVDLALARSESNFVDTMKPQLMPTKKPSIKMPAPPTPNETSMEQVDIVGSPGSSSPHVIPSPSNIPAHENVLSVSRKHQPPGEKKKSTIKTMLPTRPPAVESSSSVTFDSDDLDSELDFHLFSKHPAKRIKYDGLSQDGGLPPDSGLPMSPSFKYTKKKQPPALEKLQITTDGSDSYNTEEEKGSPIEITEDGVLIERLKSEEIINCVCGFREEDGLMIQCDICLCWQHGVCSNIQSDIEVPERYVCYICRHPYRVRSSCKYNYAVHYLTQGKLPTLSFRTRDERAIREREAMMKKCFSLTSSLHQMGHVGQSLAVKLNIAEQQNHPKLYLWAKNWRNKKRQTPHPAAPEPEAPIDSEDCRERLVKEVEADLQQLDERLSTITNQISCLEAQAFTAGQSDANITSRTMKQTIQMLMRDLKDVEKLAAITQQ